MIPIIIASIYYITLEQLTFIKQYFNIEFELNICPKCFLFWLLFTLTVVGIIEWPTIYLATVIYIILNKIIRYE